MTALVYVRSRGRIVAAYCGGRLEAVGRDLGSELAAIERDIPHDKAFCVELDPHCAGLAKRMPLSLKDVPLAPGSRLEDAA